MKPCIRKAEPTKYRRRWRRLSGILAVVVVFVMLCSLAMPAAATEGDPAAQDTAVENVVEILEPVEVQSEPEPLVAEPVPEEPQVIPEEPAAPEPESVDPVPVPETVDPTPVPEAAGPVPVPEAADPVPVPENTDPAALVPESVDPAVDANTDTAGETPADGQETDPEKKDEENKDDRKEDEEKKEKEEKEEEKKLAASPLIYECDAYTARVSFDQTAEIPEGTQLTVSEIAAGTPEYAEHFEAAKSKVEEEPEKTIASLQLYGVSLTDKDGQKVLPKTAVNVEIEYKTGAITAADEKQFAVTFRMEQGQPEKAELAEKNADGSDPVVIENNIVKKLSVLFFAANDSSTKPVIGRLALAQEEKSETGTAESSEPEKETPKSPEEENKTEIDADQVITREVPVDGAGYNLILAYGPGAGIPDDAVFQAVPVPEDHDEYEDYKDRALSAVDGEAEGRPTLLGLFDLTILDSEGNVFEPLAPITVTADLGNALDTVEDVFAVHFVDTSAEPEEKTVPAAEAVLEVIPAETADGAAAFEAGKLSVFAVVGTTLEKTILAGDGKSYNISVTYGADAGVPEGASLSVSEILAAEETAEGAAEYETYLEKTKEAFGLKAGSFPFVRFFDIRILDENDTKVEITAPVEVKIELVNAENSEKESVDLRVVHFAEGGEAGDILENVEFAETKEQSENLSLSFSADGFSVYAIVDLPETTTDSLDIIEQFGAQGFQVSVKTGTTGPSDPDTYYLTGNLVHNVSGNNDRDGLDAVKNNNTIPGNAAFFCFERIDKTNQFYVYTMNGETKQYLKMTPVSDNVMRAGLTLTADADEKTAFTFESSPSGRFHVSGTIVGTDGKEHTFYWVRNTKGTGTGAIVGYENDSDKNTAWIGLHREGVFTDPYKLDGNSYGLLNWNESATGKAMMADDSTANSLLAKVLTVMTKEQDHEDRLYVPDNTDDTITMWSFEWAEADKYYIKSDTGKYLKISSSGLSLVDEKEAIQVIPGTGVHKGQISLKSSDGKLLTYNGNIASGNDPCRVFGTGGPAGTEYLYLVGESQLTDEYIMTHSARKISVSEEDLNGEDIIIYTRFWDEATNKYEFYAIDRDGKLVRCFESGDSIEWVSGKVNTMLWQFTEYYFEGTTTPNNYYELGNPTANGGNGAYIAPQLPKTEGAEGQVLSPGTIGVLLSGRKSGRYYTPILAWDDKKYAYAGLKVIYDAENDEHKIVSCPLSEADDFYFAIMEPPAVEDDLHEVPTVDNTQYGITMKMVNINTREEMSDLLGVNTGGVGTTLTQGLLSPTMLDDQGNVVPDGYPTFVHPKSTALGSPLSRMYTGEQEVNHLFISSTYNASGYYEFDSSQNFASLKGQTGGNFTVYKELGSYDSGGDKETLKHGQFFPYNDLQAGHYTSVNKENLYSIEGANTQTELPDSDPRKHEKLYLIDNVDCYYAMELTAKFVQTPSGLDAWDHDIIFEFSGDDDFWLYVDGELIIDLGGIHSAVPGSVNFRTGKVSVNGADTTLYELFLDHYRKRYNDEEEIRNILWGKTDDPENYPGIFTVNENGQNVFKDNTPHTMRIFYMERGAGAANLHMRFNLASVKKNTVQLTKELSGVESDTTFAEFPYQIRYRYEGETEAQYHYLTNVLGGVDEDGMGYNNNYSFDKDKELVVYPDDFENIGDSGHEDIKNYVVYNGSNKPVKYAETGYQISDKKYPYVFFLKPDETVEISFPVKVDSNNNEIPVKDYYIVECGINTTVYDLVYQDNVGNELTGAEGVGDYKDYAITAATTDNRPTVKYINHVKAPQSLLIQKGLYDVEGNPIQLYDEDGNVLDGANQTDLSRVFAFRLYFGTETDAAADTAAYMYTYFVKNPAGQYCKRVTEEGAEDGTFVPVIDEGGNPITDFSELVNYVKRNPALKDSIYFITSTGGGISKIPAYYTVEVPDLLAGTKFKVVERPNETPDGYQFLQYKRDGVVQGVEKAMDGVSGSIQAGRASEVVVDNKKGFGLRLNKTWGGAETLKDREETYFAVFRKTASGIEFVPDSVRQLVYTSKPEEQTLYWYYPELPGVSSVDDLLVYEVILNMAEGTSITVSDDGVVSGYQSVTPVGNGPSNERPELIDNGLFLNVTSAADSSEKEIFYEVTYEPKEDDGDNVRIFGATNTPADLPALKLVKADWNESNYLSGAAFILNDNESDAEFGPYTSDTEGLIRLLYLDYGKTYTLTETKSPQGYSGLPQPLTISIASKEQGGAVTVTPDSGDICAYYTPETVGKLTTITIKNRPYDLQVIKVDGSDNTITLANVEFELHKQISSGGSTHYDSEPLDGYESLTSDGSGVISRLDKTLAPGTYELREKGTIAGYRPWTAADYVHFTVSDRGEVSLTGNNPEGVKYNVSGPDASGKMTYTIKVPNEPLPLPLKLKKVNEKGKALTGAKFSLSKHNGTTWGTPEEIDMTSKSEIVLESLSAGWYCLTETDSPDGYNALSKNVYFEIRTDRTVVLTDENRIADTQSIQYNTDASIDQDTETHIYTITIKNNPGTVLPSTGGRGTLPYTVGGIALILIAALAYGFLKTRGKRRS